LAEASGLSRKDPRRRLNKKIFASNGHLRLKVITRVASNDAVTQSSSGGPMKITTLIKTAVAVVSMTTIAVAGAPITSAADYPVSGKLGSELTITDTVGGVLLGWKVSDLKASTDVIPDYPVAGDLWEATATVNAMSGPVTPAVSQFNARTADGVNYRVLWQAAGPNTISGATIPQGTQETGKIYFDVTGPSPTIVAMNNGMEDLLTWGP
jgi:hypothetical protein